ncbi:hypothetical protein BDN67DRAFT_1015782 [Paxillus ammoniavirescens]|nr:hypothetical protein BDN67DRAFT_1015782 [Paxillus ammoniavirescens]
MISELDELDGLDSGLHSDLLLGPDFGELAGEIMSVMTGHSGGTVEFEEEHEEEEMSKDFNFNGIMATTDDKQESSPEIGSETDNDTGELRQRHSYPTTQRAPAKRAPPVETVGKSKGKGKAIPKPTSSERYDPDTFFKIQCAIQRLHGSKSSNIPFQISSTITHDQLCMAVTEKLGRFPGLVKLQYRLDYKELNFFIETMRSLIIPPHLANGKTSTWPMKPVTVYFEDASSDDDSAAPASTGNHSKAGTRNSGSQAASSSKQKPPSRKIGGTDVKQKHVEELQKWWTCDTHSKGSQSPSYCYSPPGSTICQALSNQNIAYWALLIMKEEATIDMKLPGVITQGVKQHTQNTGSSSLVDQAAATTQGPSLVTVQFMSLWPGGHLYPLFAQQMPLQTHITPSYPPSLNLQAAQSLTPTPISDSFHAPSASPFNPTVTLTSTNSGTEIPEIILWFNSLEQCVKKAPCGVKLADFGPELDTRGFIHVSQLLRCRELGFSVLVVDYYHYLFLAYVRFL